MAIDIEYKKVLYAAGALSAAVDDLEEARNNLQNFEGWTNFGVALEEAVSRNKFYQKTIAEATAASEERLLKEED